jgi:hypothetical protein
MNSKELGTEVQDELKKLQSKLGIEGFENGKGVFEFGLTQQISTIAPFEKVNIWFNANPKDNDILYKGCCNKLNLPYDENAAGQYVYIKINI